MNKFKSGSTFKNEFKVLYHYVPEALYANIITQNRLFITSELLEYLNAVVETNINSHAEDYFPIAENFQDSFQPGTSDFIYSVDIATFFAELGSIELDEESFLGLFYDHFGFSAIKAFKYFSSTRNSIELENYIANFGRDAYGCYLPMHAYYKSKFTPWGIYLFPILIFKRAIELYHEINKGLPWWKYVILYIYAVYRHELFHFQVERFATKFEIVFYRPFYKPYIKEVREKVRGTYKWLEEALAEHSVLKSKLIANRTQIKLSTIKEIYEYDLQFMPPGYRDYECVKFGGPEKAMRLLSSQIANHSEKPGQVLTDIMTIRGEYIYDDKLVPAYSYIHPKYMEQFQ